MRRKTVPPNHAPSPAETIAQVMQEMNRLTEEAAALSEQAKSTLESDWQQLYRELLPLFSDWREQIGAETFSTFSVHHSSLLLVPQLSHSNSPQFHAPIPLKNCAMPMGATYGERGGQMVGLCMSSQDMQFDFSANTVMIPFVLFERTVGIIAARVPSLTPEQYAPLTEATARLLESLRSTLFQKSAMGQKRNLGKAS